MADWLDVDGRVITLALARMTESVGNSFLVVVLPLFIESEFIQGNFLGLKEVAITGIVLSLFGFVNSSFQPLTGRLSDRTGRRKIFVLIGLALLGSATFAYTYSSTYWHLFILRIMQGMAGALIIPTTIALVNDLARDDNRGGNMGTYNTFRLLGFGVGPIAAGAVVDYGPYHWVLGSISLDMTGFEAAFYFAAATAFISFLLIYLFIFDPEIEKQFLDDDETSGDDTTPFVIFDRTGTSYLDSVFTLGLASFFMATGIALFATLGDPINARLNQGASWFGLQFAAFILPQIFLQAPIGRLTDHYGRKWFIVTGMLLLIPTTFFQGIILDSLLMFLTRFAQGIAGSMVFAPALALAGDLAREGKSGQTLSVLTMAFGFGIACGPLLSGFLVALGFVVPFLFGAFIAGIGAVLVYTEVEETVGPGAPTGKPVP